MSGRVVPVAVADLGTSLSRYRVADETAARRIGALLVAGAKLTPLTGYVSGDRIELVDGFKRREALRLLSQEQTEVLLLDTDDIGALAAMALLNRPHGAIQALEEAWIIQALHRKNKLTLEQIAERFGRHASWASRRLALAERLHERVQERVRGGSISAAIARELVLLPRGNHEAVAVSVTHHSLTCHEARSLVALLARAPSASHQQYLLANPKEALGCVHVQPNDPVGWLHVLLARVEALNRDVQRLTLPAASAADASCRAAFDQLLVSAEQFYRLIQTLRGGIYGRQSDPGNPGSFRTGPLDPVHRAVAGHLPAQRPLGDPGPQARKPGSEQPAGSADDTRAVVDTPAPTDSQEAQTIQA
jgi:hypothetical protein